jgi:hypothetical protein
MGPLKAQIYFQSCVPKIRHWFKVDSPCSVSQNDNNNEMASRPPFNIVYTSYTGIGPTWLGAKKDWDVRGAILWHHVTWHVTVPGFSPNAFENVVHQGLFQNTFLYCTSRQ